jgi:hypothetical protein
MTQEPLLLISPEAVAAARAEAAAQRTGDAIDPHTETRNAPVVALVGALVRMAARRRNA